MSIFKEEMKTNPSALVYLYELDLSTLKTPINTVLYWTPYRNGQQDISFGGTSYSYVGISLDALTIEAGGKLPDPRLSIQTKVDNALFHRALTSDIRGLKITRKKTFATFLDGAATPDASAFREVTFYVNGLISRTGTKMSFKLSTNYGLEGLSNKANRVLNSLTCLNKYRIFNPATGEFVYTSVADGGCPWGNPAEASKYPGITGWGTYWVDGSDIETADKSKDRCSLSAAGCMKRFSRQNPLQPIPYLADPKGK